MKVLCETIRNESNGEEAAVRRFCARRYGMGQIEMESLSEGSVEDDVG